MIFFNPTARKAVAAMAVVTAQSLVFPTLSIAQELTYLDDRSGPKKIIQSYYNAINNNDYPRAYSYWSPSQKDFDTWSKGYATTKHVAVIFGPTIADPGAGSAYWYLPVAISSLGTDGKVTVFSGCYSISRVDPSNVSAPPYRPTTIEYGHLTKTDKLFQSAVPVFSQDDVCAASQ